MIKNYLSGIGVLALLALTLAVTGCGDPRVAAIEESALNSAVAIGNQYATTGKVDKTEQITAGIANGASLLSELIANQASANPQIAATASQTALVAAAPAAVSADVKAQLAPNVANAINTGIQQGLAPEVAVQAAADGLNKGVKQLRQRRLRNPLPVPLPLSTPPTT